LLLGAGEDDPLELEGGLGRRRVEHGGATGDRLEAQVVADVFGGGRGEDAGERPEEVGLADDDAIDRGGAGAAGGRLPTQPRREGVDLRPRHGMVMRIGIPQLHHRQRGFR